MKMKKAKFENIKNKNEKLLFDSLKRRKRRKRKRRKRKRRKRQKNMK